jgi:hypothetical protein
MNLGPTTDEPMPEPEPNPDARYWHEVEPEERERLIKESNMLPREFLKQFKQPDWCTYPDALAGLMGCWSLVLSRTINSIKDCAGCECNKLGDKYAPN